MHLAAMPTKCNIAGLRGFVVRQPMSTASTCFQSPGIQVCILRLFASRSNLLLDLVHPMVGLAERKPQWTKTNLRSFHKEVAALVGW